MASDRRSGGIHVKREALQVLRIGAGSVELPPDWMVDDAATGAEGVDRLANVDYDVAIVAAPVPDFANEFTVEDLLERLLALRRSVPVVVYDHSARMAGAVRYMQIGA